MPVQIGLAFILATILALATLIFHVVSGSGVWTILVRVVVSWFGMVLLTCLFTYLMNRFLSYAHSEADGSYQRQHRLDLVSQADEDLDSLLFK